jgi:hypothetical protein
MNKWIVVGEPGPELVWGFPKVVTDTLHPWDQILYAHWLMRVNTMAYTSWQKVSETA